ncbi:MAG TPA: ubiquitin-like domain-containing protein [Anaerolineales bacterium]|nr:ubiquitin-like domain-containing protein [Anaerolineales bacterium]
MTFAHLVAFTFTFFLLACQPVKLPEVVIIDGEQVSTLQTNERIPSALLNQAGITLTPNDRVLLNGRPTPPNQPIINYPITLQIRRATTVTLTTAEGKQQIQSSAFTIGQALQEASFSLHATNQVHPTINSPISTSPVSISSSRDLAITTNGKTMQVSSPAQTVGEALAEAGIPLLGLDYSVPAEKEPLPSDGQIRVMRVTESMQLAQKPIPFDSELQASADVPLDQTQILQPGEPGLTVQRIRIRYEDEEEVSRVTEDETLVRPPRTRIMAYGTKIEVKSAVVDGVNIEYWRAVQMYATSYSPCRSGTDECHSGTSSGKSLRKGMVGLRYSWYLSMQGQQLYIPGYGFASVEDVCGGCVGRPWIDLGFSDSNFEPWHSWVTVYFLTPVPANVIYVLE